MNNSRLFFIFAKDISMDWHIIHIDETDSTNRWLKENKPEGSGDGLVAVWADYQTAGRGCGSNMWESERDKNLLFSIKWCPEDFPAISQFQISQAVSLAITDVLVRYIDAVEIKWPNDIYYQDKKLGGILIENVLHGDKIKESIIGIGLNVNQQHFHSDAPNPVSLYQILGDELDSERLLHDILSAIENEFQNLPYADSRQLKLRYMDRLYWKTGLHWFRDTVTGEEINAVIADVRDDGKLVIEHETYNGIIKCDYRFKEIEFLINGSIEEEMLRAMILKAREK